VPGGHGLPGVVAVLPMTAAGAAKRSSTAARRSSTDGYLIYHGAHIWGVQQT